MTLYFYDLETSGVNPRSARIMQFAGQRMTVDLQPLGEPDNILIKLSGDILPEPDAVLITGITPQRTIEDGISEAEFLRYFSQHIATPDTIFTGFNSIRFDDEFLRYLHYRNFYDAYSWHWQDGRGRWDLLDVVRMTRALRPAGIEWPFAPDGSASNRLELLTAVNKLDHNDAHDALSDVRATIAVAQLIRSKQPKLYDYLFNLRSKQAVAQLVEAGQPFVYSSGRYPSAYEKTTVVMRIGSIENGGAVVYDLRHDPAALVELSDSELRERLWPKRDSGIVPLPVKSLQYNRCPAVAPLGVLDEASIERLELDMDTIQRHASALRQDAALQKRLVTVVNESKRAFQTALVADQYSVDGQLYDSFIDKSDEAAMRAIRAAKPEDLHAHEFDFKDARLPLLLPLYKARNFPHALNPDEQAAWEVYRLHQLLHGGQQSRAALYFKRLQELADRPQLTTNERYLLQELQLYGESVVPLQAD